MWKPLQRLPRPTVCDTDDVNTTTDSEINNHNDLNSWSTFRHSLIRNITETFTGNMTNDMNSLKNCVFSSILKVGSSQMRAPEGFWLCMTECGGGGSAWAWGLERRFD